MVRRARSSGKTGLRVAAGVALAAVGATAIYDRFRGKPSAIEVEREFLTGRGTSEGPVSAPSLAAGYEVEDTNVRMLIGIMVVAILIMVAGVAGVFRMYASFDRHFQSADIGMTTEQKAPIVPPLPHLQAEPYRDIDAMIMEEKQRITHYGWNDAAHTSAHIPIERAMRQVVGKPLDGTAQADARGPAGTDAAMPVLPAYDAARPQFKAADHVQGEGRPGAVSPSYDPKTEAKP